VQLRTPSVEGDVRPGHQPRFSPRVPLDDPTAEPLLERPGLGNREIPVMRRLYLQGP
jgi:hypothetical protein